MNVKPAGVRADLERFLGKRLMVRFVGGRIASGVLMGVDDLANLVLDDTIEYLRDLKHQATTRERKLGLLIVRGVAVETLCPQDTRVEIENPFNAPQAEI